MSNELKAQETKCFTCGAQISFKNKDGKAEFIKNKLGKSVFKRFNLDGSQHICEKKEGSQESKSKQSKKCFYCGDNVF